MKDETLGIVLVVLAALLSRRCGWDSKPGSGHLRLAGVTFGLAMALQALALGDAGGAARSMFVAAGVLSAAAYVVLSLGVLEFAQDRGGPGKRRQPNRAVLSTPLAPPEPTGGAVLETPSSPDRA